MQHFARTLLLVGALVGFAPTALQGQSMPPEARRNIHLLLNQHEDVRRTVTMNPDGYTALTESEDPAASKALRAHVEQMADRLKAGLRVRQHDPAFSEFVAHYSELAISVNPTKKGLQVVVVGSTPAAIKVAQNHARVVSDFAATGWAGHDRNHPAVLVPETTTKPKACSRCCAPSGACARGNVTDKSVAAPIQKDSHPH